MYRPDAALIVQADGSILAEVHAPSYSEARDQLARFAELVKWPGTFTPTASLRFRCGTPPPPG